MSRDNLSPADFNYSYWDDIRSEKKIILQCSRITRNTWFLFQVKREWLEGYRGGYMFVVTAQETVFARTSFWALSSAWSTNRVFLMLDIFNTPVKIAQRMALSAWGALISLVLYLCLQQCRFYTDAVCCHRIRVSGRWHCWHTWMSLLKSRELSAPPGL